MSPHSRARSGAAPVDGGPTASGALVEDPVIAAQIAQALAPHQNALSPAEREAVEETLWMMLATHPVVAPWADGLRRDARNAQVEQSGPRPKQGALGEEAGTEPGPSLRPGATGSASASVSVSASVRPRARGKGQ